MKWMIQSAKQKKIQSANLPFDKEQLMNEEDVDMFIRAYDDFLKHLNVVD